ncbi:gamma-tubulin complex component 2-like isoform X2 [Coccinella septempunctata]|uniref:gamma-tubulin complex component 2-like isoform X2 n=1 Tax=Coccinella septempunctata TaxID=41139 RepID=UPI001D092A4E|nr:gamma-tubulin complex component 2-like isoform X2 [Coccinella septempunctata]
MSEFALQHLVSELVEILGGKHPPDKVLEILQKSISKNTENAYTSSQIAVQTQVQQIVENLEDPQLFLSMFEDLKQKNVDNLGPFVNLIHLFLQDPKLKVFLHKKSSSKQESCSNVKATITKDDLPQVRSRLKNAITKSSKFEGQSQNPSSISGLNTSTLPVASTPTVVSWVQRRPNMSWDFSCTNLGSYNATVPVISQENILIDDLLNIMIGLPGCYIEPEELKDPYGPRTFKINDNVPLHLKELVKQILPIASHYSIIQRFIEEKMRFEFGQVNNALAEKMAAIIKEHTLFVVQLESEYRAENLDLQKLWFFVQRNMQTLAVTANIASTISKSDAVGGKVLSLLHDRITSFIGDDKTQNLCVCLMEAACVPYMKMLSMWIYHGIITDPIKEFLIEDNEVVQKEEMPLDYSSDYWDKKYAIRRERIPKFLEPMADKILKAGKYLNVIRQCGKPHKTKIIKIQYKIEEKHYIEAIEKAYVSASQTLLDLVIKEKDLIGRLKSVKNYFLLEKGDFIITFLNLTEKEMSKTMGNVIQGRLEALMDLSLRLSSAINDPYKDDLQTDLLQHGLQFQMFKILSIQTSAEQEYRSIQEQKNLLVIETFAFSYKVHWPLSLILNKKSLMCYQMIFRHLFYCKHVDRMICQVWRANKVAKKFPFEDAQQYRAAFALRQKMLHCVQNLEYHMMVEVIEPHWCSFMQKIAKVNNVDEILFCHSDFLDSCLKDCMLTIPHILATIIKILSICVEFCKFIQRTQRYFVEAELGSLPNSMFESYTAQTDLVFHHPSQIASGQSAPSFKEKISEFDAEFTSALLSLLDQINELNKDTREHDRLFNLLYRIAYVCPGIDPTNYLI